MSQRRQESHRAESGDVGLHRGDEVALDLPPGLVGHVRRQYGEQDIAGGSPRSASRCRRMPRISSASPCTNACTEPAGKVRSRTAVGAARRRSAPGAVQPLDVEPPATGQLELVVRAVAEQPADRGVPAGTASSEAAIAGSADSSPTSRCQSASGSGRYPPSGPSKTRTSPGRAAAAQGPATPRRRARRSRGSALGPTGPSARTV